MSVFGQSVDNSLAYEREKRRNREGCPLCRSLHEECGSPPALGCGGSFHRGEPGRLPTGDLRGVVPLPRVLCRAVPCACPEGEGHNSTVWQVYEDQLRKQDDRLERELRDLASRTDPPPRRYLDILDRHAGIRHSETGAVARALAEILAVHAADLRAASEGGVQRRDECGEHPGQQPESDEVDATHRAAEGSPGEASGGEQQQQQQYE